MSRSQLILVVAAVLASCGPRPPAGPPTASIVIEDAWRRCPPRAPAPAPPARPRSVEQLARNAWAWRDAWSGSSVARDVCASRLAEVIRAIEQANASGQAAR